MALGCGDSTRGWALTSAVLRIGTRGGEDLGGLTATWHGSIGPGGTLPEPRPLPLCFPRPEKYDDHWRYDPRFTGSFDDEPEPHRDPYGEEVDRRSEHSARSLHSSFSSHSHQVGGRAGAGLGPRVLVAAWVPPQAWRRDFTCLLFAL